ncbi:MAG: TetR/AcrR family transcriptional regulator [Bdellovibrionales bacterium]|nr:TetR/AcrR family transcriptional regulator [Bdellovibrionales bacterium]
MSKGEATKKQILDTAVRLASTQGINGLTIGELARKVGMSKSGLFAHFGAKDQLQLMVLQSAADRFVERVMKAAFLEPKGEARVRALFNNWLEFINGGDDLPGGSVLLAASVELDDQPGPLRDFVQKAQWDLVSNIEKAIQFAMDNGDFRPDLIVRDVAFSMYSFILGYNHFRRMLEAPDAERLVRESFEGLMSFARNRKRKEDNGNSI